MDALAPYPGTAPIRYIMRNRRLLRIAEAAGSGAGRLYAIGRARRTARIERAGEALNLGKTATICDRRQGRRSHASKAHRETAAYGRRRNPQV